jgi:hypothetical protein
MNDHWNVLYQVSVFMPIGNPRWPFLLRLVAIGTVVSEKKLEMWKVYRRQTTDDGRQVMAIVHLDLWSQDID